MRACAENPVSPLQWTCWTGSETELQEDDQCGAQVNFLKDFYFHQKFQICIEQWT